MIKLVRDLDIQLLDILVRRGGDLRLFLMATNQSGLQRNSKEDQMKPQRGQHELSKNSDCIKTLACVTNGFEATPKRLHENPPVLKLKKKKVEELSVSE